MIKNWLKKVTGVDKIEEEARKAAKELEEQREKLTEILKEKEAVELETELAKLSPKERATRAKEPWVAVLETKVNQENIRNGFFELDWNEFFIAELIYNGYGTEADPQEEIVDRWFRDIVYNMFANEGLDTNRGAGYINVVPISKGKSEVS